MHTRRNFLGGWMDTIDGMLNFPQPTQPLAAGLPARAGVIRSWLVLSLVLAGAVPATSETTRPAQPNIVLLLIDDLGWQDAKCYDIDQPSPMETPHIDALATKGVLFWQAYSPSPVCSPSRAAILSGHHPARGEMTSVAGGYPPHPGHPTRFGTISPWYSSRMPTDTFTLAEALKAEGYVTGHSGKWHVSHHHYDYPNPFHHGFDFSTHHRGVQHAMQPDRLTGFATRDPQDPYRLDEHGFPFDVPQDAALTFIREQCDQPFFLYYATWLVHGPWLMRSEAVLRKYEQKLGVTITEKHKDMWDVLGQKNPFYCAMVEQLDYYLGQIFRSLEQTDDPRWPGHKLIENTYIIFTSDNGGTERNHVVTDNYPLDRGKISLKEGGTRVPLIITGPGIPAGVQTDVMANGLDFYPTILSLIGAQPAENQRFDGCDLAPLLTTDPTDPTRVRDATGQVRDTMVWHFPHAEKTSSIRVGDYKLLRRYAGLSDTLELYRLYNSEGDRPRRVDIEEQQNLAAEMPEKTAALDARLTAIVDQMGGRRPYFNPQWTGQIPHKDQVPTIVGHQQNGRTLQVTYRNHGARIVHPDLIYTPNDGREWRRTSGRLAGEDQVIFTLPKWTTHYFVNLVDENNFLVIYPPINRPQMKQENLEFQDVAIFAGYPEPETGPPVDLGQLSAGHRAAADGKTVLLDKDFQDDQLAPLTGTGAGVSITTPAAGTGQRRLRLQEAKGLKQEWMPLVGTDVAIPSARHAGTFRLSLDVMLDPAAPGLLNVIVREHPSGQPYTSPGDVRIGNGRIKAGWRNVMAAQPGTWYHLELSGRFGPNADKMLTLSATTADGRACQVEIPYDDIRFDRPTYISLASLGPVGSAVQVDNLVLTVED